MTRGGLAGSKRGSFSPFLPREKRSKRLSFLARKTEEPGYVWPLINSISLSILNTEKNKNDKPEGKKKVGFVLVTKEFSSSVQGRFDEKKHKFVRSPKKNTL